MTSRAGLNARQRLIALGGLIVIVGAVLAVLLVAGVLGNQGGGKGIDKVRLLDTLRPSAHASLAVGPAAGEVAPDFEISAFDGTRHRLSEFRGKVVYVNFWATWCQPCVAELPDIADLLDGHASELVVITVDRAEPLDRARNFFATLRRNDGSTGVNFTVDGLDPDDTLFQKYRALGTPTSLFIDASGVISSVHFGAIDFKTMEQAVAEAQGAS